MQERKSELSSLCQDKTFLVKTERSTDEKTLLDF